MSVGCESGLWRAALRSHREWVCVGRGAGRVSVRGPGSLSEVPGVCWGPGLVCARGPGLRGTRVSRTLEWRVPPPLWPRLRSPAGESCSAGARPGSGRVWGTRTAAGPGGLRRGPRLCPRGRGRKRAGLRRGLTASAPARSRPPAGLRDASRAARPRGPKARSRAWAGEGRRRNVLIDVASAASASPERRRRHILSSKLQAPCRRRWDLRESESKP